MPILSWGECNDLTHAKFNMQDEKQKTWQTQPFPWTQTRRNLQKLRGRYWRRYLFLTFGQPSYFPHTIKTSRSAPLLPTKQKKPNTNWKPMDQNTGPIVAWKRMHFGGFLGWLACYIVAFQMSPWISRLKPDTPCCKPYPVSRPAKWSAGLWRSCASRPFAESFYVFKTLWLERSWKRHSRSLRWLQEFWGTLATLPNSNHSPCLFSTPSNPHQGNTPAIISQSTQTRQSVAEGYMKEHKKHQARAGPQPLSR